MCEIDEQIDREGAIDPNDKNNFKEDKTSSGN